MDFRNKTKEELIFELQELKQKYDSLQKKQASDASGSDMLNQVELEMRNEEMVLSANTLRQYEAQYKSLFENNHSVMLLIDPSTGEIKDANMAACQFYGWTRVEFLKKNIFQINTLSEAEVNAEMLKAETEKRKHYFFKHRLANGKVCEVEVYSGPIQFGKIKLLYSVIHDITDRKIAEEKLQISEEKYRNIFETMLDAYYEAGLDGKVIDISPSIEIVSKGQYTRDELIGKQLDDVYYDFTDREAFFSELYKYGKVTDYELALKNKDGSVVPVSISSRLISDKEGNPVKIAGTLRDITARKLVVDKLKQSNQKLEAIIASSPYGIGIVSLNGNLQLVSDKLAKMYGYDVKEKDEFVGKPVFDFIDPLDHKRMVNNIRKLLAQELSQNTQYLCIKKDGNKFFAELNSTVLFDIKGKPESILYLQQDITERKLADNAIKESELQYRTLANSGQALIWTATPDKKCDFFNQVWLDFTGRTLEQELGDGWVEGVHPDDLDRCFSIYSTSFDQQKLFSMDYRLRRNDGEYQWFQDYGKPRYDSEGNFKGYIGHCLDITEIKNAKEKLQTRSEELAIVNNQLTMAQQIGRTGSWSFNLKTRELKGSIESLKLFGLGDNPADFTSENIESCIPERERVVQASYDLLQKGLPYNLEYEIYPADGSPARLITSKAELKFDDDGIAVEMFGVFQDISDRKQNERILWQSEQKYKTLFFDSPMGYLIILDGRFIECNRASELLIGGDRSSLIGKTPDEISPVFQPNGRNSIEYAKELIEETFVKGNNSFEWTHRRVDGTEFIAQINLSVIEYEGNIVLFTTWDDITERKQTEIALKISEEKYRDIFINAQEGIFQTSVDGSYISVNPALAKMYGFESPEEMMNSRSNISKDAYVDPNERRNFLRLMDELGYVKGYEYEVKRKDGCSIWLYEDAKAIKDKNGKIQYFDGYVIDITDRKLAENTLNDKNNLLTNLIVNMQESILLENKDRKIALTNKQFCDMFGIPAPPEALIGADCSGSAEESKHFFKNPEKFITDINLILANKIAVFNDTLELVDGRHFQRDYIPTYVDNQYTGHLWKYRDITELKMAEEGMKKLSQAIEQSPVMTYITGTSGLIEYANPKVEVITGYSSAELLGQNPRILSSGEKSKKEYQILWKTISSGKEWRGEFHNKKKNGEFYWVSASISPVTNENGNITHFLAIEEDITQRKLAEENIKKQNDRLNAMISAMPDLIFVIDEYGIYSEFFYSDPLVLSIPKEKIIGTSLTDFFGKEKADDYLQHIHDCIHTQKLNTYEYQITENNRLKYFEARIAPYGENKILSVVRDVTASKVKETEIKKLSLAIEQSPVSIVITDTKGNIEYVNPAFEHTTGYSFEEAVGQNPRILKSGKMDEADYQNLWKTISSGKEWHSEWINRKKNGELYWEDISISPFRDESGKITNYLAVKQDITERKQVEEKINKLNLDLEIGNANLEIGIIKRTSELALANVFLKEEIEDRKRVELALNESEKKYRIVVENVNEVIFQTDAEGLWLFLNKAWEDITGFSVEESLNQSFVNYVHPDDRARNWELFEPLINREKDHCRHEIRYMTKDGGFRWIEVFARLGINDNDEITGTYGTLQDITDRRQAEAALAYEKQRLASIIEGTNLGTWEWNIQTGETIFNDHWAKIIGYTLDEISPVSIETWMKFAHPDDLKQSEALLEKHFKGELDYYSFESRLLHKNGEWVWVLDRGKVHTWTDDGKPLLMSGTHQDITERKKAGEEIEESRETHRGLSEAAFDSIFFSEKGICIEQNSMAEKVFGYTDEEALGRYGTDWIIPEHRKIVLDNMMAGYEDPYEVIALRKDGTTFPCMLSGKMMFYKGRNVRVTSLNDITERKRAEELLKWNKTLLELMSNASPLGFLVVDNRTDDILYFNQRFCQIWGIEQLADQMQKGELKNNDIIPYCLPVLADIPAFAESCKPLQYEENRIVIEDEIAFTENRTIRRFSTQIRGENDEYFGRFYIFEDITEAKRTIEFQQELLLLSVQLNRLNSDEIFEAISHALHKIAHLLTADRAYIFEINDYDNTMSNTYEWCNEGVSPEIENLQNIPVEIFPNWMKKLRRFENIEILSVKDLPESWIAEREILEPQGIQSLLVIPIMNNNQLIGFVGLDSVKYPKEYSHEEKNNLKVWSNMLSGILNRQKNDLKLDQTRQNYETFFNTIDDFLFVLDEQGNIIHNNNTVINRLGYTNTELMAQSVLMVHPPDRRDEAGRIVGEMLAGTADFCPVPLVTKSGNYISVETRVKPGNWNGKPVIFGVSKDISKIKLSEEKFSKAFQTSAALMAISGLDDGIFIDVNDTFIKTLGYPRDVIVGKSAVDFNLFVDPDVRKKIYDDLNRNIPVKEVELKMRPRQGTILTGLFSADKIYVENKLCLLTLVVDITERKLTEEALLKAKSEAENANRAKSEFLSRISHELRTPLNSILGFAQLMEMADLSPVHKRNINYIFTGGKHLLNLINEVLDISSIEAGKISLNIEPVQLFWAIYEIIDALQPQLEERQIKVELDELAIKELSVMADNKRLKQILINLLDNAIKYNKIGGVITISALIMPKDKYDRVSLRISITDTGKGINADDIFKIFNPFERIGAEKTETLGTGLGLAVVKKLIIAMEGEIGVHSVLGEGSTFWFELPISVSNLSYLQQEQKNTELTSDLNIANIENALLLEKNATLKVGLSEANKLLEAGIDSKNEGTILIIEDNNSNIDLVEQIIQGHRAGIRLITDSTGSQALQLAIENAPDLILLDLNLPDIHGSEILVLLQAEEKTQKIPVIVISADAMPEQIEKLIHLGAKGYLTKPLDVVEFTKVIDKFIVRN